MAMLRVHRRLPGGWWCTWQQPMPMELDVVVVGTVLGQKDCSLALPTAVGMLVLLVESVHECGAAEQCATPIALGNVSSMMHVRICHAHTRAVMFGICRKQGCVLVSQAVEVVNLPLQPAKLMLMCMSHHLSVLDSVEGVDAGGQTQACACGAGCEWHGVLSFEVCYVLLQLTVRLLVGVHFALCLSELSVCS